MINASAINVAVGMEKHGEIGDVFRKNDPASGGKKKSYSNLCKKQDNGKNS